MTSTGLGRHNSKPLLDWDDVDMDDESPDGSRHEAPAIKESQATQALAAARPEPRVEAPTDAKDKGASPWSAMRKLFKR